MTDIKQQVIPTHTHGAPNESITFSERNASDNTVYQAESSLSATDIQAITEQFLSDATLQGCYAQKYIL
jgi:hypothetical protein